MCGRYTLRTNLADVGNYFDVRDTIELPPRFNIAPTQDVPIVRLTKEGDARELAPLRWGLIPSWAKDPAVGARNINARSETVTEKPTFRTAFRKRRCLIPADGFFEWKPGGGKTKQPHYICLKSEEPFAFAGLWEIWGPQSEPVHSFTIITTEANTLLRPLHSRMPVILPQYAHEQWLDATNEDTKSLVELLQPFPSREMQHYAVSSRVNSHVNDDADCLERVAEQKDLFG